MRRARAGAGNRGPARFSTDGKLYPDILDAYWQYGFYVFEGVVAPAEIEELRRGVDDMVARAPVTPDAKVDAQGRPAFGLDFTRPTYSMSKPLQDPWGATNAYGGRHQVKMTQPTADADAPDYVVLLIHGMCQAMPAGLRVYGHPTMLAIAESINGEDFVPYNDSIIVKQPGLGASVAWHQDGVTHWDASDWDAGSHGVNFQFQLYPTTPGNCLWVVPGTHKLGRLDIKRLVAENSGDDRLPDAIPLICEAGDLTIVNRQMLHGSFANSSPDARVSITAGFHRRRAVLGQKALDDLADGDLLGLVGDGDGRAGGDGLGRRLGGCRRAGGLLVGDLLAQRGTRLDGALARLRGGRFDGHDDSCGAWGVGCRSRSVTGGTIWIHAHEGS